MRTSPDASDHAEIRFYVRYDPPMRFLIGSGGVRSIGILVIAGLACAVLAGCTAGSSGGPSGPAAPSTEATPLDRLSSGTPASGPDSSGVFVITSEAMAMTLQGCQGCDNDHILVSRLDGHSDRLHDGDIVVFHPPPGWKSGSGALVLRVIAMGGETVKGISTEDGQSDSVMVSEHGTAGPWRTLNETMYVYIDAADAKASFGPVTVPAGRVWVMGDHRNDSADSRDHCGSNPSATNLNNCNPVSSTVPISDIIGIATRIVSPLSRIGPSLAGG